MQNFFENLVNIMGASFSGDGFLVQCKLKDQAGNDHGEIEPPKATHVEQDKKDNKDMDLEEARKNGEASDPLDNYNEEFCSGETYYIFDSFIRAAFVEEFFKACVIIFYCTRKTAFDEPMDGVIYGIAASLGFAAYENIDYVLSAKKIPGIPTIAEWLDVGVGKSFISRYKQKYNLA